MAVEVRSPSTWRYDTTVRFRIYEAAGVAEVWVVDTASKSVLDYRRSIPTKSEFDIALELGEDETLETPPLPEFSLNITALFSHPSSDGNLHVATHHVKANTKKWFWLLIGAAVLVVGIPVIVFGFLVFQNEPTGQPDSTTAALRAVSQPSSRQEDRT